MPCPCMSSPNLLLAAVTNEHVAAARIPVVAERMHPFEMTRALIDMESITENEKQVGEYLVHYLSVLAAGSDGRAGARPGTPERFHGYAGWGRPRRGLSTPVDPGPP